MAEEYLFERFARHPTILMLKDASETLYNMKEDDIEAAVADFTEKGYLSDINISTMYTLIFTIATKRNDLTNTMFALLTNLGPHVPDNVNLVIKPQYFRINPCLISKVFESKVIKDYYSMINAKLPDMTKFNRYLDSEVRYIKILETDNVDELQLVCSDPNYVVPKNFYCFEYNDGLLGLACLCGAPKCVKFLITSVLRNENVTNETILFNAYRGGNAEVIRFLEQLGAKIIPDFKMIINHQHEIYEWIYERFGDELSQSNIRMMMQYSLIHDFVLPFLDIKKIDFKIMKDSIPKDSIIKKVMMEINEEFLQVIRACCDNDLEKVKELLEVIPPNIIAISEVKNNMYYCEKCIYAFSNYNTYGKKYEIITPLLAACRSRNADIINYICSHPNADINLTINGDNRTSPLLYSIDNNYDKSIMLLLKNPKIKYDPRDVFYKICGLSSDLATEIYQKYQMDFSYCEEIIINNDFEEKALIIENIIDTKNKFLLQKILDDESYQLEERYHKIFIHITEGTCDKDLALMILRHERIKPFIKDSILLDNFSCLLYTSDTTIAEELIKEENLGHEQPLIHILKKVSISELEKLLGLYEDSIDPEIYSRALICSIKLIDSYAISLLLKKCPQIDINYEYMTKTALIEACSVKRPEIVKALLTLPNIDVNKSVDKLLQPHYVYGFLNRRNAFQSKQNVHTPLIAALESNDIASVLFLLEHPNIIVNSSHIEIAINLSDTMIINLLLEYSKDKEFFKHEDFVEIACVAEKSHIAKDLIEKYGLKNVSSKCLSYSLDHQDEKFADYLVKNFKFDSKEICELIFDNYNKYSKDSIKFLLEINYFEFPLDVDMKMIKKIMGYINDEDISKLIMNKLHQE